MLFNLSNEEYYCQFWRKYFENIFEKIGLKKTSNKQNVEIGHYNFATKIAYGFPFSYAKKKFIHLLFKNEPYYPKSILINRKWIMDNSAKVWAFMNEKRKVLKNDNGVGAKNVFVVTTVEECFNRMNHKDYYVLQTEIDPLLHKGFKLDERVYYLTIKEGDLYSGYLFKEGHIKLAGYPFNKNDNSIGCFATNIKAPKPPGSNGADFTIDTTEFLKEEPNQNTWIKNRTEIMKKISQIFLPALAQNVKNYYKGKKEPKYIWHLYGVDLLIDKEYNFYLCEFNGKPGVLYETVMPKKITSDNKKMCNRIALNCLAPWIKNNLNNLNNDKTIIKLSDFKSS